MKTNKELFVSIIIPCRNEVEFIPKCLDSIIANDFRKEKLEVLVVDGISKDNTRKIVKEYAKKYSFIRLIDNPKKITPAALNTGISYASGEVIIRMDAHADYEKEYISKCVKYLYKYKADNVGGTMITKARNDTFVGKAIVFSLSHRFGVGNSVFRTGAKEPILVDTVFGGCYKKEIFNKIGLFNEHLKSSQDMEFNLRLKKSGGKILFIPDIVCYYYALSDYKSFCKNNCRNGFWAIYPIKYTKIMPVSWRHLIPLAFVSCLVGLSGLSIVSSIFFWPLLLIFCLYLLTNIYFSLKIAQREKQFRYFLIMPFIFGTLHIIYGIGSLFGFFHLITSTKFWKSRLKKKSNIESSK